MLYATGQQVSSQSYPGAFLPRVQMVPAAHMNSAAMQTLQAFGGNIDFGYTVSGCQSLLVDSCCQAILWHIGLSLPPDNAQEWQWHCSRPGSTYRPPVSSAQTYSSTQIAPLNTASRPASTARPSSQPAPAVYQVRHPTESALESHEDQTQHASQVSCPASNHRSHWGFCKSITCEHEWVSECRHCGLRLEKAICKEQLHPIQAQTQAGQHMWHSRLTRRLHCYLRKTEKFFLEGYFLLHIWSCSSIVVVPRGMMSFRKAAASQRCLSQTQNFCWGSTQQAIHLPDDLQLLHEATWLVLQSLKRKAQASLGDPRAEVEPLMEVALVNLADEFISNAVAFSCGLARRRKSLRLDSADVATYLDRTW